MLAGAGVADRTLGHFVCFGTQETGSQIEREGVRESGKPGGNCREEEVQQVF